MPPEGLVEAIVPAHGELMGIAVSVQGTRVFRLKGKAYPLPTTRPSPLVTLGPILASVPLPDGCVCIFFYFFLLSSSFRCFIIVLTIIRGPEAVITWPGSGGPWGFWGGGGGNSVGVRGGG